MTWSFTPMWAICDVMPFRFACRIQNATPAAMAHHLPTTNMRRCLLEPCCLVAWHMLCTAEAAMLHIL